MKNRSFRERAGFALAGWTEAWRRERSFRTQVFAATGASVVLVALRPGAIWWALVAVTCGLVLALELVNSALEAVIDRLHPDVHPDIKAAKDMLAGAVLFISAAAIIVAGALALDVLPVRIHDWGIVQ